MTLKDEDVGTAFDQISCEVTVDLVDGYRRSVRLGPNADGSVPSALASVYTYGIIAQLSSKTGAVLVGQRFRFHRAPRIGDTLLTDADVTARYEKRGRQYMEIATRTSCADGTLVCHGVITRILPQET